MKREIITIDEYSVLTLPSNPTETVWMNECELVELIGANRRTLRAHIKSVLKSDVVHADFRHGATQCGNCLLPDYYGLDMIMALAFRIHSPNTQILRKYIVGKLDTIGIQSTPTILVQVNTDKKQSKERVIFN